jgi:hypothetical protein
MDEQYANLEENSVGSWKLILKDATQNIEEERVFDG